MGRMQHLLKESEAGGSGSGAERSVAAGEGGIADAETMHVIMSEGSRGAEVGGVADAGLARGAAGGIDGRGAQGSVGKDELVVADASA